MIKNLKTTLIQSKLHWEDAAANRRMFSEKMNSISEETDLIILPEMFTTGFSMNASNLAEETNGKSLNWMISEAKKQDAAITGSVIIKEESNYYNRLFFVFPDGSYKTYDKKHTFTFAGEHKTYSKGTERLIVEYKGWKICPLVCYDLRFPVWSRNTEDYDLLLYVACWPKKRTFAWDALLRARAIENMSYCIGVNRVGVDGNGHEYNGHSAVYNVLGKQVSRKDFETEFVETLTLTKGHIATTREHLKFLQDRDRFRLI
ncbi:amidohydrolase [Marixanthomonas spongiae]|uniref:Omega-amidase YafV n=1 Tax=Marixanthomonas spongiae TaxID=2174845 RepID=A0A2U0HZ38_9FLAO|nr:amidohydrolase [Marixanthomonas spongiae]PVW14141.1 amidohydrolase [Marixanthomonas spongiae]